MWYNQLAQKQTNYSCSIYAFLNIIKYDYWIEMKVDNILKLIIYMEKIGALLTWWASAWIIYPALVKYVEWKTGFKLKIVKWTIDTIDNKKWWILWLKKSNKTYIELSKDWVITKSDIDKIVQTKKWYWHFHMFKKNTILETLWGFPYRLMKLNLEYAYNQWLYYTSTRAFIPWDERTEKMQKFLIKVAKEKWEFMSYEEFLKIKDIEL